MKHPQEHIPVMTALVPVQVKVGCMVKAANRHIERTIIKVTLAVATIVVTI